MKRWFAAWILAAVMLTAGTAGAENLKGRLGVTGRLGFIVPSNSDDIATNTGIIGGGGLLYGLNENIGLELDITHAAYGSTGGPDFSTTNIAVGAQYRFNNLSDRRLVPYIGAGLDFLVNGIDGADVDTVAGVHLSGGADYFLTHQLAATAEMKGVIAPNADIHDYSGAKVGNFDPMSFSMTFGLRYFFN